MKFSEGRDGIEKLECKIKELEAELDDSDKTIARLESILNKTVLELRGPHPEGGLWSWHDIPDLVKELKDAP